MKARTLYFVFTRLRSLVTTKLPKVALPLVVLSLVLVTLVFWAASGRVGWAQENTAEDSPSLRFLDAPLALKVGAEDDKKDVYAHVHNGSGLSTDLVFSTRLRDVNGETQEVEFDPKGPTGVDPRSVTSVHLEMDADQVQDLSLPLKGFLLVSGMEKRASGEMVTEVAPGTLPLTITSYEPRQAWLQGEYVVAPRNLLLFVPFAFSALLILLTYVWFRIKEPNGKIYCPLRGDMKALGTGLAFDPSKSWATLLTGVAAVVTPLVGATVFPETRVTFTKNDVIVLALTFGALLAVAPMIYNGRRGLEAIVSGKGSGGDEAPSSQPQTPAQGSLLALLATSAAILGALLGQLTLAFLLVNEIENLDVTGVNRLLLWVIVGLVGVYACFYLSRSISTILREEVRWGEGLRRKQNKLEEELEKIDLKDKVLEERIKVSIRKEIDEIKKQRNFGTRPRDLMLP